MMLKAKVKSKYSTVDCTNLKEKTKERTYQTIKSENNKYKHYQSISKIPLCVENPNKPKYIPGRRKYACKSFIDTTAISSDNSIKSIKFKNSAIKHNQLRNEIKESIAITKYNFLSSINEVNKNVNLTLQKAHQEMRDTLDHIIAINSSREASKHSKKKRNVSNTIATNKAVKSEKVINHKSITKTQFSLIAKNGFRDNKSTVVDFLLSAPKSFTSNSQTDVPIRFDSVSSSLCNSNIYFQKTKRLRLSECVLTKGQTRKRIYQSRSFNVMCNKNNTIPYDSYIEQILNKSKLQPRKSIDVNFSKFECIVKENLTRIKNSGDSSRTIESNKIVKVISNDKSEKNDANKLLNDYNNLFKLSTSISSIHFEHGDDITITQRCQLSSRVELEHKIDEMFTNTLKEMIPNVEPMAVENASHEAIDENLIEDIELTKRDSDTNDFISCSKTEEMDANSSYVTVSNKEEINKSGSIIDEDIILPNIEEIRKTYIEDMLNEDALDNTQVNSSHTLTKFSTTDMKNELKNILIIFDENDDNSTEAIKLRNEVTSLISELESDDDDENDTAKRCGSIEKTKYATSRTLLYNNNNVALKESMSQDSISNYADACYDFIDIQASSDNREDDHVRKHVRELQAILENIRYACQTAESLLSSTLREHAMQFQDTVGGLKTAIETFQQKYKLKNFLMDAFNCAMKSNTCSQLFKTLTKTQFIQESHINSLTILNKDEIPRETTLVTNGSDNFIINDIRRIGHSSILLKWSASLLENILGYDVLVNNTFKTRVYTPQRTSAILDNLQLKISNNISVYALNYNGRCSPAATAVYKLL